MQCLSARWLCLDNGKIQDPDARLYTLCPLSHFLRRGRRRHPQRLPQQFSRPPAARASTVASRRPRCGDAISMVISTAKGVVSCISLSMVALIFWSFPFSFACLYFLGFDGCVHFFELESSSWSSVGFNHLLVGSFHQSPIFATVQAFGFRYASLPFVFQLWMVESGVSVRLFRALGESLSWIVFHSSSSSSSLSPSIYRFNGNFYFLVLGLYPIYFSGFTYFSFFFCMILKEARDRN